MNTIPSLLHGLASAGVSLLAMATNLPHPVIRRCAVAWCAWLLAAGAVTAQSMTFVRGVSSLPNAGFHTIGSTIPVAGSIYFYQVSESGPFAIQNRQVGLNGINILPNSPVALAGVTNIDLTGIVPIGAAAGAIDTVTLSLYSYYTGQLVARGSVPIQCGGTNPQWARDWSRSASSGPLTEPVLHIGDFDGDGADEILGVAGTSGTADRMTLYDYVNGSWVAGWTNAGNPSVGNGIYPYRGNMVVGDFNGDGRDDLLGISGWLTVFSFLNGNWQWGFSTYGSTTHGLYPYRNNLVAGDFDGDGRDELLGNGGWVTMFRYVNNDFVWSWSSGGIASAGEGLGAYNTARLYAGDLDGNGDDEILALGGWGTTFNWLNGNWRWGWSTGSSGSFGGWGYPLVATDRLLVGKFDHTDARAELLFVQTASNAAWASTMDFPAGVPVWRSSTNGTLPFLHTWPLASLLGTSTEYRVVRPIAGQPARVLARRVFGTARDIAMLRVANTTINL